MLYVLVPRYALTDYIFEGLDQEPGIRIIDHPHGKRGQLKSLQRIVEAYLLWWLPHSWCYDAAHLETLRQIGPEDAVLFFAIENRKDLQITRKFIRARQQSIWLWNPIRSYRNSWPSRWFYKWCLQRAGVRACTFDPEDARQNKLELVPQVFRRPSDEVTPTDIDVYFVGIDKGRLAELKQWRERFEQQGLRSHFHIVPDKRKEYAAKDLSLLTPTWMPYPENLQIVRRSRCMLELLQGTQSGPTIRCMEALFFGRKLMTNNASMTKEPFYHPSQIFIIGRDKPEDLPAFLNQPIAPARDELLNLHEIRSWLRQFA